MQAKKYANFISEKGRPVAELWRSNYILRIFMSSQEIVIRVSCILSKRPDEVQWPKMLEEAHRWARESGAKNEQSMADEGQIQEDPEEQGATVIFTLAG